MELPPIEELSIIVAEPQQEHIGKDKFTSYKVSLKNDQGTVLHSVCFLRGALRAPGKLECLPNHGGFSIRKTGLLAGPSDRLVLLTSHWPWRHLELL